MAIQERNILKKWLSKGCKPTAQQFADWVDSYWHKNDSIPSSNIGGLSELVASKAEQSALEALAKSVDVTIESVSYDSTKNTLTFTKTDGTTQLVELTINSGGGLEYTAKMDFAKISAPTVSFKSSVYCPLLTLASTDGAMLYEVTYNSGMTDRGYLFYDTPGSDGAVKTLYKSGSLPLYYTASVNTYKLYLQASEFIYPVSLRLSINQISGTMYVLDVKDGADSQETFGTGTFIPRAYTDVTGLTSVSIR